MLRDRLALSFREHTSSRPAPHTPTIGPIVPSVVYVETLEERALLTNSLFGALVHIVDHATLEAGDPREAEVEQEHEELIEDISEKLGGDEGVESVVRSVIETVETIVAFWDDRLDERLGEIAQAYSNQASEPLELSDFFGHVVEHATSKQDDPGLDGAHVGLVEEIAEKVGSDDGVEDVVRSVVETTETVISYVGEKVSNNLEDVLTHIQDVHGDDVPKADINDAIDAVSTVVARLPEIDEVTLQALSETIDHPGVLSHVVEHATLSNDDPRFAEVEQEHEELITEITDLFGDDDSLDDVVRAVLDFAETVVTYSDGQLLGTLEDLIERLSEHQECLDQADESACAALEESILDEFFASLAAPGVGASL